VANLDGEFYKWDLAEHAMTDTANASTPRDVLAAVDAHADMIVVDLDETLYLRNSTEDFLDCIVPGLPGRLLLKLLDMLQPWRLTGGVRTRDAWRVRIAALLFPWIWAVWRRRAPSLARDRVNSALLAAIRGRDNVAVATLGFAPVVRELLHGMNLGDVRLVACRFGSIADRRAGKLAMARAALGGETVRRAMVVTDSEDDAPLLAACARPFLTRWPNAEFVPALSRVYLPFHYLSRVKRPGQGYFLRAVAGDDFVFWVLASIALAGAAVPHLAGLFLLLLSFWTIYERGYVDNDAVAATRERAPVLSDSFHGHHVATPALRPWLWSAAFGGAGLWVLAGFGTPSWQHATGWGAVLAGTYLWFLAYNRLDKATRIWMFAGLQLARAAAVVAVVPVTAIGAVALGAHAFARWVPYYVYRVSGAGEWPDLPVHAVRLLLFAIMAAMLLAATGTAGFEWWTAAALFAWCALRAGRSLLAIAGRARSIHAPPASASASIKDAAG
jgi:hypothetical protein